MNHAIYPAVGCRYFLPGGYLRSFHQMVLPVNGSTHLITALLLIYRPRKDERLSWPSWLTCSGWFTHISGHPSAAGQAQDREKFASQRPTFYHCATPPTLETLETIILPKYHNFDKMLKFGGFRTHPPLITQGQI